MLLWVKVVLFIHNLYYMKFKFQKHFLSFCCHQFKHLPSICVSLSIFYILSSHWCYYSIEIVVCTEHEYTTEMEIFSILKYIHNRKEKKSFSLQIIHFVTFVLLQKRLKFQFLIPVNEQTFNIPEEK